MIHWVNGTAKIHSPASMAAPKCRVPSAEEEKQYLHKNHVTQIMQPGWMSHNVK